MNLELPDDLEAIKNAAIDHFWSKAGEAPDLTPLLEWFEEKLYEEGNDFPYHVYIDIDYLVDSDFHDYCIRDLEGIPDGVELSDQDRIEYARKIIETRLLESENCIHVIELVQEGFPPVALICFLNINLYTGWTFDWKGLFKSFGVFRSENDNFLLLDDDPLTDNQILSLWKVD